MELNQKAQKAMTEVDMLPGEEVINVFQGDGYFLGSSPAAKAIALLQAGLTKLTGGHIRAFLVLTNFRCLMVQSTAVWCGWQRIKSVNAVALSGIKEAGISKETQMCCIHTRLIHVESLTERNTLIVKKFKDSDLKEFLRALSVTIINNSTTV